MAKLQLYISKSVRGNKNVVNINPEEDIIRYIHDYKPALDIVDYDTSASIVFYLVTYLEQGVLVSVIRTVAGGAHGEHIAASIFFPIGIDISTDRILELTSHLANMLSTNGSDPTNEQIAELRSLFATNYNVAADAPAHLPASGHVYAYTYFGPGCHSLREYVDSRYYHSDFAFYAGVLLIDKESGAHAHDPNNNLTREVLHKTAVLCPPKNTREGFAAYIYHKPLTRPIVVPLDTRLEIQWKRPGFETFSQIVEITNPDEKFTPAPPSTSEAHKVISPASFYITEQGTQRVVGAFFIKVNDVDIDRPRSFTYGELVDAKVEINSPGYFAFSGNLDLASTTQALVQLRQLRRTYRFDLPLHTPDPTEAIRIYLKSRKPIVECPVDGYKIVGDEIVEGAGVTNNLVYVGGRGRNELRKNIVIAAVALLAGIFIGWLAFDVDTKESQHVVNTSEVVEAVAAPQALETGKRTGADKATEAEPVSVEEPVVAATADFAALGRYLDTHKVWRRAELDAIPGAQGFFDDLNNYNFDRIINYWQPNLSECAGFVPVYRAVLNSNGKRNPRTGAHSPTYNADGDEAINWLSYTYWVDP